MKKFDIPYNFQDDYFEEFEKTQMLYPNLYDYIESIYLPCFTEDGTNTRETVTKPSLPKTWEEYLNHINLIKEYNLPICILFQKINGDIDIIQKYYNIGIRIFCLNNDKLAQKIKEIYPDVYLILSITRGTEYFHITQNSTLPYDKICLKFEFNKRLDLVEKLPKTYEYSILVNSNCVYNCEARYSHWFYKGIEDEEYMKNQPCYQCRDAKEYIYIYPNDIHFFDDYITTYKLVDRINLSKDIFNQLLLYLNKDTYDITHPHDREYYIINKENGNS